MRVCAGRVNSHYGGANVTALEYQFSHGEPQENISANSRLTFPSKVVAIQKGRDTPVKSSYVTGSHMFIES